MRKSTLFFSTLVAAFIAVGAVNAHATDSGIDKIKTATKKIANEAGDYLDDSAVTTDIKAKYMAEKGLDSLNISVKTIEGVVFLTGDVDNFAQSRLAEVIAKNTKSVKMVTNKLVVKK